MMSEKGMQLHGSSRTTEQIAVAEAIASEAIEPEANRSAYREEEMRIWKFINGVFYQLGQDCPIFGILVIGETGTGKSTLINNLLGHEAAAVGHSMESETQFVTPHERSVEGVPVVVYDTPGLGDTSGDDDPKHLEIMKSLLDRKKIHLVIYCMKLTETRMRSGLIRTFEEYHKIGVPWKQTVVTLTFADKEEDTTGKFSMMQQQLKKTLIKRVNVTSSIVDELKICLTAKDPTEALPNGKRWYVPFWLDVVEVLVPAALAQFLYIHKDNIQVEGTPASRHPNPVNITLVGEDQERFQRQVDRLPKPQATISPRKSPPPPTMGRPEAGATSQPSMSSTHAAAEFLDYCREQFIAEVDASTIVLELEHRDIISHGDQRTIRQEVNATLQAQLLHACLKKTCDAKALTDVYDIIATVKGNPRMKSFGEHMKTEWAKVSQKPSRQDPPTGPQSGDS